MRSDGIGRLLRSWFDLTPDEQTAAVVVLSLFLLGVLARWVQVMS